MSGGELLARLRGDGDERPVIVSSATATAEDAASMLSLGADDVLVKPVHHRMLVARVTAQLRRRRMPALSPGEMIDGRYRLNRELGESRVGSVWRAHHTEFDIDVDCAIVGSRGSEALRREAARAASLTVPGFLRVRDVVRLDSSRHLAVSDALPEQTAKARLERGVDEELAFHIVTSVLDVVVALHGRGLAHRNLSANSVFVGDNSDVVVVDGATLRLLSTSKRRVGMTAYLPPEMTMAGPGTEADVYAVARLTCHLLTGSPDTIPEHPVAPALRVALAPQPSERCTARALLRAVAIAGRSRRRPRDGRR